MHLELLLIWIIFVFRLRFPPGISIVTILKTQIFKILKGILSTLRYENE